MTTFYTENALVQQTTANYLKDELGWDESVYAFGEKFGPGGTLGRESEKDVVLTRYLRAKLVELNPGLPDEAYRDAIRKITETGVSQTLIGINREKDRLHKNGVDVVFRNPKGEREKKRLRVFDFDNPENNHFLVVREFRIKGDIYRRRADIVGFVNGIPLVFMELKNLHKHIRTAFEQNLSDYKDTVPHLLHHNAFIVLGNGVDAKIGSVSSQYGHFHEWKRLAESEPGVVSMETLLKGVCAKHNFMDLFENFILFDLLKKPDLSKKEIERLKQVSVNLLETLKREKLKIENWREREAMRDAVRQNIFDFLYDEKTGLPMECYDEREIKRVTDQVFRHIYHVYPTVPSPYYSSQISI